jgi:HPt (histidine-containing phosphotransfer) domain-containing protein
MMTGTAPIPEYAILQLNEVEILERLGGDSELLGDLCDMALTELPRMMQSLAETVKIGDANAVHRAAHRLKGALSVFGEGPHIHDCLTLEAMALEKDLSRTPEILSGLESHVGQLCRAVATLGRESHAHSDRR